MIKQTYILCLLLLSISLAQGYAQEIDLSASNTTGCDSMTVRFTATSASVLNGTFNWIFENGLVTLTDGAVVSHTYTAPVRDWVKAIYTPLNASVPSDTDSVRITIYPMPDADFYQQTEDALTFNFNLINGVQFDESITNRQWTVITDTFGTEVTYTNQREINQTFNSTGSFPVTLIVSLTGISACADTVTKNVIARDTLLIPNVFTPNDDGINDFFLIRSDGLVNLNFVVYTRYGFQVFKYSSPNIQWDGRNSAGVKLKTGVYYYVLSADDGNPVYNRTGFIHLFDDDATSLNP